MRFPYVPGTELRTLHVLTLPILPSNCAQGTITVSIFQMENWNAEMLNNFSKVTQNK